MKNENNANIVDNMMRLAAVYHQDQYREGNDSASGRKLPYILHLMEVTNLLRSWGYTEQDCPEVLAIGWGHDLLEDTDVDEARIEQAAGPRVLSAIKALTFKPPKGISDEEFDRLKAEYVSGIVQLAPAEVLAVKIADRICNVRNRLETVSDSKRTEKARRNFEKAKDLFDLADRLPFAEQVKKTIATIRQAVCRPE